MNIEIIENEAQFNGDIIKINGRQIGRCLKGLKGDCLFIQNITIFDEFKGTEYGKSIIETYREIAKNKGCLKIECEPSEENIEFWEKIGFKNISRIKMKTRKLPHENRRIYQKII